MNTDSDRFIATPNTLVADPVEMQVGSWLLLASVMAACIPLPSSTDTNGRNDDVVSVITGAIYHRGKFYNNQISSVIYKHFLF